VPRAKTKHEQSRTEKKALVAKEAAKTQPVPETSSHVFDPRNALLKSRTDILASLGINQQDLSKAEHVSDDDQAKLIHDQWISLSLNRLEYKKLRLVDEALDRIAAGDYGVCPNCDESIAQKRLQAIPWAKYCVSCQEQLTESEEEFSAPGLPALYSFTRHEESTPRPVPVER
jgi:DnaK suppressor protein